MACLHFVISRITRQGFPAAHTLSGMSFVTKLPVPITTLFPIFTSGRTQQLPPIHTLSPMVTGIPYSKAEFLLSRWMGCPAYTIHELLSHYPNYSAISHRECEFFCILIHPMLLCTLPAYKKVSKTLFYSKHSHRQCSHRQNDCCRQWDPFFIFHADSPLPTSSVRVCRE